MLNSRGRTSFCHGCEFAGSIPEGVGLNRTCISTRKNGTKILRFLDDDFRVSAGIVDADKWEVAPDSRATQALIADCAGDTCNLEQKGFVPLETSIQEQRVVVAAMLNKLQGVRTLGVVSIDQQTGVQE